MRVKPTTLGLELPSVQPMRLHERKCKGCDCTIDLFNNKFRGITRKWLFITLENYFLCEPCYRESQIDTIIKK